MANTDGKSDNKSGESFLSRWSRRKVEVLRGTDPTTVEPATSANPAPVSAATGAAGTSPSIGGAPEVKMPQEARPEPTSMPGDPAPPLPSVESLTRESDFAPFMRVEVSPELRNQAMKKLFTDPHYNVMDRLDIYIDDYGKPDPIPPEMLRMMNQSKALGLFEEEERAEEAARKAALGESAVEVAPADTVAESQATQTGAPEIPDDAEPAPAEADNRTFPFAPVSSI